LTHKPLQVGARIAGKRCAVDVVYIADQPAGPCIIRRPGENQPGIKIGLEIHIRFLHTRKPFDGGAVKHHLAIQRLAKLLYLNFHILYSIQYICMLISYISHILIFCNMLYILIRIFTLYICSLPHVRILVVFSAEYMQNACLEDYSSTNTSNSLSFGY